jgi:hypothetical protein
LEKTLIHPSGDYNPDIPIDEQTSCLPYDPKWEFPKKRLRQGKLQRNSTVKCKLPHSNGSINISDFNDNKAAGDIYIYIRLGWDCIH